nr:ROK family protein [Aquibacillus sediminis]
MGGTTTEIGIMNLAGTIIDQTTLATQTHTHLIDSIATTTKNLLENNNLDFKKIYGIGVGVPGITDFHKGIVIDAPSLGWRNKPIKEELEQLLPCPVYLDNDVNVAALGEQWKGTGKTKQNFVMITLGTGIGCGLIINGNLYRGFAYAAGEIGYMITNMDTAKKNYTQAFHGYGFLDSHVGGPSISSRMADINPNEEPLSAKEIFQLANKGNPNAKHVVNETISHLSFALINLISILNPAHIVLGGGISKSMHPYLPSITTTIQKHLPIQTTISITNVEHVSLLGAAYLVLREHKSVLIV